MFRKPRRRRTDPLMLLASAVALGMTLTVGFQLSVHSGTGAPAVVSEAPAPMIADG